MKRVFILLALCLVGVAAIQAKKTKYICSIGMGDSPAYVTEFATHEECRKYCDVCEETDADTVVTASTD